MWFKFSVLLISLAILHIDARPSRHVYGRRRQTSSKTFSNPPAVDPGQPLFLTPLIKAGRISEALTKSAVTTVPGITSYSGYITVNATSGANMFFWAFLTKTDPFSKPVVIWLQGGPGASSLYGLFVENGPLKVDANNNLSERQPSWADYYNMLYIDNPVGTGFSFVSDDSGFVTDENGVADHLYTFLLQYYQLFPQLVGTSIFVAGESYAGKYVPAIAARLAANQELYRQNGQANPVATLAGAMIGNGFTDPESMLPMGGNHLYALGLLNEAQREYFNEQYEVAVYDIQQGLYKDAFDIDDYMINADFFPYPSYFTNVSGCTDYFNCLLCNEAPPDFNYYVNYVQLNATRANIHVGSQPYGATDGKVEEKLINDVMNTCKPQVEYLLTQTNIPLLFYSGNLDLIVPTVSTDNFLRSLNWPYREQWLHANRTVWTDEEGEAVSYSIAVNRLFYEVVRNAGHMVPYDQPQVTLRMINDFVSKALIMLKN